MTDCSLQEKRALLASLLAERGKGRTLVRTSFAQERLWFLTQLEPDNPFYNIPAALRLRGRVDVGVLERSLNEIVGRHGALRTNFVTVEGRPMQAVAPEA